MLLFEQTRAPQPLEGRFWTKVSIDYAQDDSCWLWLRAKTTDGYGLVSVKGKLTLAHRASYELVHGPIPAGLELDHLCRVRHCVNPTHLEAVTHRENQRRASAGRPAIYREEIA